MIDSSAIQEIAAMSAAKQFTSSLPGGQPSVVVPDGFKVCVLPTDRDLAERPVRVKALVAQSPQS